MSKTILCADDSATIQKVGEITFAATEYRYVGARTADEALKLARAEKPALILADAVMPGKNGYDLCRAIKSDAELANIPVLIMCGNSQAYDAARGEPAGADGHVTKPWDTQVMLDRVADVLARMETGGVAKLGEGVGAAAAAPASSGAVAASSGAVAASSGAAAASGGAAVASGGAAVASGVGARPPTPPPVSAPPVAPPFAPSLTPSPRAPSVAPAPAPPPRPASQPAAQVIPPSASGTPRSATIMGMPAFPLPPASDAAAATPAPTPVPAPAAVAPAAPSPPPVRAAGSSNDASASLRPPMIKGTPQRRLRLVPISETAAQVASEHGIDPDSPEMQALLKLSREVVERIVWEVVPDLAEAIIKQNLDKLTARAGER